jgi:hypothetical protein
MKEDPRQEVEISDGSTSQAYIAVTTISFDSPYLLVGLEIAL